MKEPKYIEKILDQHEKLGESLQSKNSELWNWLDKNGIKVDIDDIYCQNSILIITEPRTYASGIRELIKEQENE